MQSPTVAAHLQRHRVKPLLLLDFDEAVSRASVLVPGGESPTLRSIRSARWASSVPRDECNEFRPWLTHWQLVDDQYRRRAGG